ncbi:MAG: hypothetical protein HQL73_03160 [Magnetococcales bacterium]|nr:hypothetical protein [Magnetococcales bacterium]
MKKTTILGTICASAILMLSGTAFAHCQATEIPCDSSNIIFPAGGCDTHPHHYYGHPCAHHSHSGVLQLGPEVAVVAVPVAVVDTAKPQAPAAAPAKMDAPAAAAPAPAKAEPIKVPSTKSDATKPDGKKHAAKKAAKKTAKKADNKAAKKMDGKAADKKMDGKAADKKAPEQAPAGK